MLTLGVRCLLVLGVGLWTATASAQTKMTIATGVDPVFSAYYVAQQEGLFKKHGLDVRINTGPSGSAMVSFLINGQIESAFGSEIAGVSNHNLDPNVVVVAQATRLVRWIAIVGRNVDTLDQLKGKKLGVARGSGGEVFWLALIDKLKLNPADYTVVNVEAPEMVAALERGNIDAYAVWEPWVTGAVGHPRPRSGQEHQGAPRPGRHPGAGRLHLHEPRLDPEESGAGGRVHARPRRGDGHHQQGPKARRQGRVRLPQEPRPAAGGTAHDQAPLRDGPGRLHHQPVPPGRDAAEAAGQAHQASRSGRVRVSGSPAQGPAQERQLQAVSLTGAGLEDGCRP